MIEQAQEKKIYETKDHELLLRAKKAVKGPYNYEYCMENGKFYLYQEGLWKIIHPLELIDLINKTCRIDDLSNPQALHMIEFIKRLKKLHLTRFNWCELLNMNNGMINPYDGEMEPHSEIYYSTIRIPYDFDPNAKCELWLKSLHEIFEGDTNKISMLQEFLGYCLTRDTRREKALLLLGESRSGKSTILNTIEHVMGSDNCSAVSLHNLNNQQYTSMMIGKLVNIDKEVNKKAENFEAEFKSIVTGEIVQCNDKYMPPFNFKPFCKLLLSANIFPRITDHSSAFYNRLILIPCDRIFTPEEQNINLRHDLLLELPGILNWGLEGLKRLNERGKFEISDFLIQAVSDLEAENNPTIQFFREHVEIEIGEHIYIEKGELYDKYKSWCSKTNNYILPQAKFSSSIFKQFYKETPKNARILGGKRIWRNLKYLDNKDETVTETVMEFVQEIKWEE